MKNLSAFWKSPELRTFLQNPPNEPYVRILLEYIQTLEQGYVEEALEPGDTEFKKGKRAALKDLRADLVKLMSDTGTETGA